MNVLYTSLEEKVLPLSSGTPQENQAVFDEAEQVIDTVVLPAYRKLHNYASAIAHLRAEDGG